MVQKKKTAALTPEERLQAALVPDWEQPYKVPGNWCWVNASFLFRIEYGRGLSTKQLTDTGYPVFGANGRIGYYSDYMYEDPQVLMSCRGAYSGHMDKSVPYSYITSNSLIISCIIPRTDVDYICYLFSALDVSKLISGTAQPQVTVQAFDGFAIPLPPLPEQQRIVDRIESLFAKLDEAKEKVQAVVDSFETRKAVINRKRMFNLIIPIPMRKEQEEIVRTLESLLAKEQQAEEAAEAVLDQIDIIKKSILSRAFRGELGTNDPSEESAVELLKQVLETDAHIVNKPKESSKRVVIPSEIKSAVSNANEKEIIKVLVRAAPEAISIQSLMSISKKKFELMDALRSLENKQLIIKNSAGKYSLMG